MAVPRVFISSTYYDLKHIRSSLEKFVESLGFEAVLSEKGSIAYSHDRPLDESCYREVRGSDILVLVMGGRYGSPSSTEDRTLPRDFFQRYDSITKKEFEAAVDADIPIYILVERPVQIEYETFLRNRSNKEISYVQAQSVNVFLLFESILNMPRNNPVHAFERPAEIEEWLRIQWAGLFGDLLRTRSQQQQLASLSAQVANLSEVNKTLKVYLEEVVSRVSEDKAADLIKGEHSRLQMAQQELAFRQNPFVAWVSRHSIALEKIATLLETYPDNAEFCNHLRDENGDATFRLSMTTLMKDSPPSYMLEDIEAARRSLGLRHNADLAARADKNHGVLADAGARDLFGSSPQVARSASSKSSQTAGKEPSTEPMPVASEHSQN